METRLSLAERSLLSALTTVPPGVGLSHVQTAYAVIQREAQRQADAVRILATLLPLAETVAGNDPSKEAIEQFWEAANAARAFLGADATKAGKRRRTISSISFPAPEPSRAHGRNGSGNSHCRRRRHDLPDARSPLRAHRNREDSMSFWYLAAPYSKYPGGIEEAFKLACREAATLVRAGIRVYSPITHTHPMATYGEIDPYDHGIWLSADAPFMRAAKGLIVLRAESWEDSYGIKCEIEEFQKAGKPVVYMDPGIAPEIPA